MPRDCRGNRSGPARIEHQRVVVEVGNGGDRVRRAHQFIDDRQRHQRARLVEQPPFYPHDLYGTAHVRDRAAGAVIGDQFEPVGLNCRGRDARTQFRWFSLEVVVEIREKIVVPDLGAGQRGVGPPKIVVRGAAGEGHRQPADRRTDDGLDDLIGTQSGWSGQRKTTVDQHQGAHPRGRRSRQCRDDIATHGVAGGDDLVDRQRVQDSQQISAVGSHPEWPRQRRTSAPAPQVDRDERDVPG